MLLRSLGFFTLGIIFVKADLRDWSIRTICTKSGKGQYEKEVGGNSSTGPDSSNGLNNEQIQDQTGTGAPSTEPGKPDRKKIPSHRKGVIWEQGIIPYYFNTDYYGPDAKNLFDRAIVLIELASCLRFQKLTNVVLTSDFKRNWLHITNEGGQRSCSHFDVNAQENNYEITTVLGYDCLKSSEILHTLLHGVGLADEITHPKRDTYVSVLWDNIQPRYHYLFRKTNNDSYNMKVEYDPTSVMHFYDHAFTQYGKPTIIPIKPGVHIAPSEFLSELDQIKLSIIGGPECSQIAFGQVREQCEMASDKPQFTEANPGQDSNSEDEPLNGNKTESTVETKVEHTVAETIEEHTEQTSTTEELNDALHGPVAHEIKLKRKVKKHRRHSSI